jgi:glyoxylase-like metal-dependent hydrolase (beta-lactamase superfamily II)
MSIKILKFITGPLETNTYLVVKNNKALIIDPSSNCEELLNNIKNNNIDVKSIILTHGHFDHILGIPEIEESYPNIDVWVNPAEKPLISNPSYNGSNMLGLNFCYDKPTKDLMEGTQKIDEFYFDVLFMPGHSPGGIAIVFKEDSKVFCFSGDSLFAGSIGRYDFPGSDGRLLIDNIKTKLLTLPDDTIVYPGHGGRTTIAREKKMNLFLI